MTEPLRGFVRRHVSHDVRRRVWRYLRRHPLTRRLARVSLDEPAPALRPPTDGARSGGRAGGRVSARRAVPTVVELTGGHHLAGDGATLPVVLVLAVGVPGDELVGWADELARAQAVTAAFRPLWLTDCADLALLRRHGWAVDTVVSRATWGRLGQPTSYDAYVQGRVAELRRRFRASVLPLTGAAPADGDARARLWWAVGSQ